MFQRSTVAVLPWLETKICSRKAAEEENPSLHRGCGGAHRDNNAQSLSISASHASWRKVRSAVWLCRREAGPLCQKNARDVLAAHQSARGRQLALATRRPEHPTHPLFLMIVFGM